MATISIPKRVCDRPGCGETVGARGGRVGLDEENGPDFLDRFLAEHDVPADVMSTTKSLSVDLCRSCAESLRTWWSAVSRRAAAKEGASQ